MTEQPKVVYWHGELPPLDAEFFGEHTVEATSGHVPDTIAHREELWNQCEDDWMIQMRDRLTKEVAPLGGRYGHVLDESIGPKHDPVSGEAWLHGRYSYVLYR